MGIRLCFVPLHCLNCVLTALLGEMKSPFLKRLLSMCRLVGGASKIGLP